MKMTAVRIKNKLNIVTFELPQHEMFVSIFLSNMTEEIIKYEVSFGVLVYNIILKIGLSGIIAIGNHTHVCVNKSSICYIYNWYNELSNSSFIIFNTHCHLINLICQLRYIHIVNYRKSNARFEIHIIIIHVDLLLS